jgi:hypothetical protein
VAESTLSFKFSTLRERIGYYAGYTATSSNWTTEQARQIQDSLEGGLRQFYHAPTLPESKTVHRWSFLEPTTGFTTVAPHETGTVTIVDGVVTFSSATVPAWAAGADLFVDNATYQVNTRDSSSQVTLVDLTVDADAGSSYSLRRPAYTLPDDFAGLIGPLVYRPESYRRGIEIPRVSDGEVLAWRSRSGTGRCGTPVVCAVRPQSTAGSTGQRHELLLWPIPDDIYYLDYKYHAIQNTLSSDQYPMGGQPHAQTVLASCLAYFERHYNDMADGPRRQEYLALLRGSIGFDSQLPRPEWSGVLCDTDQVYSPPTFRLGPVEPPS